MRLFMFMLWVRVMWERAKRAVTREEKRDAEP